MPRPTQMLRTEKELLAVVSAKSFVDLILQAKEILKKQ
jgi:hypothetical protein